MLVTNEIRLCLFGSTEKHLIPESIIVTEEWLRPDTIGWSL
jgi:hypothetical protein